MLCRQLVTNNPEEMWFIFGGQPIHFSLLEFHQVIGLLCAPFPPPETLVPATTHCEGSSPYWYKLIGGKLGGVTVKEIVERLKSEPTMPAWRKFHLALVVLVEGVLICKSQPVKSFVDVVEMVKNVTFFLNYPWGRLSFQRLVRTIRVGTFIPNTPSLIAKLKQSSIAVQGFPLSFQLLTFAQVPPLHLPHSDVPYTFLDQHLSRLPKCKSFRTENIMAIERAPDVSSLL